jgi:hypothetical protein
VAHTPLPVTYDEPTVMWRMRRGDTLTTHAVVRPRGSGASVAWYLNHRVVGTRDFEDWTAAIQWTDRMQFQNWTAGWRLVQEADDRASTRNETT